jgi:hypothetical protein
VHTLGDVTTLLADLTRLQRARRPDRLPPDAGGSDEQAKPGRKVLRRLGRHLGHQVEVPAARRLLTDAAVELGRTPWGLDHAIRKAARPEISVLLLVLPQNRHRSR